MSGFTFGAPAPAPAPAAGGFGFAGFGIPAPAPAPAGFAGFGAPAPAPAPAAAGFAGFGMPAPAPAPGAAPAPAPAGFAGFGAPAPAPAAAGFAGFGTPAPAPAAAGGFAAFGTPAPAPAAAGGFAGFGAPAPAPAAAGGFAGFGAFGTPAPAPAAAGGFGGFGGFGAAPAPAAAGGFAGFGGFGAPAPAPAIGFGQNVGEQWEGANRIRSIQLSYAPCVDASGNPVPNVTAANQTQVTGNEEKCGFDAIVYDRKPTGGPRPPSKHKLTQRRLEEAERNNPDPTRCIPVRLLGIEELRARYNDQCTESQKLLKSTDSLQALVSSLEGAVHAEGLRFQGLRNKQIQLYNKMLSVMRRVEVLRCYGFGLSRSEHRFRERIEALCTAIEGPRSDILRLVNIQAQREHSQEEYADYSDEKELEAICAALDKQRQGLQILTDSLTKDTRDILIIKNSMKI